uniref:L-rhamnose mutarotase n=1 Tax=Entomoneis paludosa TaxID=265537 RepID=A0A7S2YSR4_9STRA|mmetsp:Transcript_810/g.1942  ORF Transcript_810/g.1942 Transcript_810/m.1942 type:complete len:114 (+) Transcript_810:112-453(+)|eukprot:CAMPEP_0172459434 /NCGR_PEP_ID=MMETSP1065-20121228/32592_1 /TAXON_ID=265537 /ORGANISM="Amphiprora paludosa, Strain CCMP125" /LENGTH=113 /DNA_ID=CAMNT_0013214113 /DNA_START=32 /DNA_END=373 /DNA_ORIENTATION=-
MARHCFACDLKDQPELIKKYKEYHATSNVWPEIPQSIHDGGITDMQIYLTGNRLFMIMETKDDDFSFEKKSAMDAANPKVQEWETLMDTFQQRLPWADEGVKWVPMEKIFQLE